MSTGLHSLTTQASLTGNAMLAGLRFPKKILGLDKATESGNMAPNKGKRAWRLTKLKQYVPTGGGLSK
ncbi:hypothetical protein [Pseudomonas phage PSA11]|nr:hypothetical protein [Pseudomonas phage PSA11]